MNNILLISHDGLASGAKKAAELILGEQPNLMILELTANNGIENFKHVLYNKIAELTANNNKLFILCDLKNGTPYNCALSIIASHELWHQVTLFSGMNLNLVLEVVMFGDSDINEHISNEMVDCAKNGIAEMNKTIWVSQLNVEEE